MSDVLNEEVFEQKNRTAVWISRKTNPPDEDLSKASEILEWLEKHGVLSPGWSAKKVTYLDGTKRIRVECARGLKITDAQWDELRGGMEEVLYL